jgi:hypothetical protein
MKQVVSDLYKIRIELFPQTFMAFKQIIYQNSTAFILPQFEEKIFYNLCVIPPLTQIDQPKIEIQLKFSK